MYPFPILIIDMRNFSVGDDCLDISEQAGHHAKHRIEFLTLEELREKRIEYINSNKKIFENKHNGQNPLKRRITVAASLSFTMFL